MEIKDRLLEVSCHLCLVPADLTSDTELNVPCVRAEGRDLSVDAPGTTARLSSLELPVALEGAAFIGLGSERVVGKLVIVVTLWRAGIIVFGANVPAAPEVTEGSAVLLRAVQGGVGIASSGRSRVGLGEVPGVLNVGGCVRGNDHFVGLADEGAFPAGSGV